MPETLSYEYVHDLVRQGVSKATYGDDLWGAAVTERLMIEFRRAKIGFVRDETIPDFPKRRASDTNPEVKP